MKRRKANDGDGNSTTISDLDDNMLTQILFRLSSCTTVLACTLVNKRWCSLISDPRFASYFSNHKKESTTILSKSGPDINDDDYKLLPWTIITTRIMMDVNLPSPFNIVATFMDLVLCSSPIISPGGVRVYFITNPLTKQWVALPPCPVFSKPWVGLVRQQPYDDFTQNYKFRVVVINQSVASLHSPVFKLAVYCSEIGEWKKVNLSVSIKSEVAAHESVYRKCFKGVVCNGIVYLHHRLYLAAFNPFDVDETTDIITIEANVLPMLPVYGYLRESSGKLFVTHTSGHRVRYNCEENTRDVELELIVWKLDQSQVPLVWKQSFEGKCIGNFNRIESTRATSKSLYTSLWDDVDDEIGVYFCGMHPNNDNLIYMAPCVITLTNN